MAAEVVVIAVIINLALGTLIFDVVAVEEVVFCYCNFVCNDKKIMNHNTNQQYI